MKCFTKQDILELVAWLEEKYFMDVMETGRWDLEEGGYRVEMAVRVTAVVVSMGSSAVSH